LNIIDSESYGPRLAVTQLLNKEFLFIDDRLTNRGLVAKYCPNSTSGSGVLCEELAQALVQAGIKGVFRGGNWYGFISADATINVRSARSADVVAEGRAGLSEEKLEEFLKWESRYPFENTPEFRKRYPLVSKILSDGPLH
jgi:hypothetical protein